MGNAATDQRVFCSSMASDGDSRGGQRQAQWAADIVDTRSAHRVILESSREWLPMLSTDIGCRCEPCFREGQVDALGVVTLLPRGQSRALEMLQRGGLCLATMAASC
mmetsp:Transcript_119696/g.382040  ORF Transcript_119696/g.382040 Transcript_119696/m.382040 type:complete len:107 (+) Transcript_119696:31-351(+)